MTTPLKLIALATAALGIAGCSQETAMRFNSEAGSQIDGGVFGDATMHNMMAQVCNRPGMGKGGLKGGGVTDPVVVLDPSSTHQRPIYRVHCDGHLNGKYAQVIFQEYITSAVPEPGGGELATGE